MTVGAFCCDIFYSKRLLYVDLTFRGHAKMMSKRGEGGVKAL